MYRQEDQTAFAPPKSNRLLRGWDRAAVSAHAPRLQGHKVWKKPAPKTSKKAYDENDAQVELLKEGAGARKKSRMVGAKENINLAVWDKEASEAGRVASKAVLTPNGRKANVDVSRHAQRSLAISVPADSQIVPRKRTNNNHIISPKKQRRQSTLDIQGQRQSLLPIDNSAKRPKKAMRKSGRRSSMGLVPLLGLSQDKASFDYRVDPPATMESQDAKIAETPASRMLQRFEEVVTPIQQSPEAERTETSQVYTFTPMQPTPRVLRTPRAKTPKTATEKSVTRSSRGTNVRSLAEETTRTPLKAALPPKTPTRARSAALEALLNSPGEAPPTLERARKDQESGPIFASPVHAKPVSPVVTRILTPHQKHNSLPIKDIILQEELERDSKDLSNLDTAVLSPTIIEVSVKVDISSSEDAQTVDTTVMAEELRDAATAVEDYVEQAQIDHIQANTDFDFSLSNPLIMIESKSFVETALQCSIEASDNQIQDASDCRAEELLPVVQDVQSELETTVDEICPSQQATEVCVSEMEDRPHEAQVTADPLCEDLIVNGNGEDAASADDTTSSPVVEEFSTFLSPSQQLKIDLDEEIARSPLKQPNSQGISQTTPNAKDDETSVDEFALPPPAPNSPKAEGVRLPLAPIFTSYDHDDTDMLLSFVSRVKAGKSANSAPAPKRKRSLPHSPLKLPLGTITDEGSLSPPLPFEDFGLGLTEVTGSPSKRRRTGKSSVDTAEEDVTPRRSTRSTRLPVKSGGQPPTAPSFIPVRRLGGVDLTADGDKSLNLKRSEEKELAALTKVNTRKNKGSSAMPAAFLAKTKKGDDKEEVTMRQRALKELFEERKKKEGKGKCLSVRWAEELAQFREFNGASGISTKSSVKSAATVIMPQQIVLGGEKAKKVGKKAAIIPTPKPERDEVKADTATCVNGIDGGLPVVEEKKTVKVGVRSKIALGMAVNGTPAPKRRATRGRI